MINKKRTSFIVLGLAALSLGTIGFSSWIISGINGTVNNDVNVKVGDVVDKRLTYELVEGSQELKLNFDADKKASGGGVVAADPEGEDEDLTFGFSFRIYAETEKNYSDAISGKKVYLTFSTINENFKSAVTSGYILSPITIKGEAHEETGITSLATNTEGETPVQYTDPSGAGAITRLTYSIADYNETGKSGKTVELTYSFAWGEVFHFKNPVELTSDDFKADEDGTESAAETALNAIGAIQSPLNLDVTLTVK